MTKKIYVLTSKWEEEDSAHVEAAFTTLKGAQEYMMDVFNQHIHNLCDYYNIEPVKHLEVNESDSIIYGEFGDFEYSYNHIHACVDYDVYFIIESCELAGSEDEFVYIVSTTEKREGDDAEFFVLGQFDTLEEAQRVVERQYDCDMDCLNSDEDNDEWKRIDLDDLGSFRYEYDQYTYFEYKIEKRGI